MEYKLNFKKSVSNDLKKINKKEVKRILDKIQEVLIIDPTIGIKLTAQFKGLYKYRVGHYRIIYSIQNDTVLVLRIGHRKSVYKRGIEE